MMFRLKFAAAAVALLAAYAIWTTADAAVSRPKQDPGPTIAQNTPAEATARLPHAFAAPAPLFRLAKSGTTTASSCKQHCKSEGASCKQLIGGMPGAVGLGYGSACRAKVMACMKKC
jgi:hypothetical protein